MTTELERFTQQLHDKWLPDFCLDPRRKFSLTGLRDSSITLTEFDAHNFLRAIESGLVCDTAGGGYRHRQTVNTFKVFDL